MAMLATDSPTITTKSLFPSFDLQYKGPYKEHLPVGTIPAAPTSLAAGLASREAPRLTIVIDANVALAQRPVLERIFHINSTETSDGTTELISIDFYGCGTSGNALQLGIQSSPYALRMMRKVLGQPVMLPDTVVEYEPAPPHRSEPTPEQEFIQWLKEITGGISDERIGELLGVTRTTIDKWKRGVTPRASQQQRITETRKILQVALRHHATPRQLMEWFDTRREADQISPADALRSGDLGRARLLALTTLRPSTRNFAWVREPVPLAFKEGAEHPQEAMPPEPKSGG